MNVSDMRTELLEQHASLRQMIEETRVVAESARDGAPLRDDLRARITRLADAVRRHNLHEEELLREITPGVDAWAATRSAIMFKEHIHEHEALYAALIGLPYTVDEFAGAGVGTLLDLLLQHMDREEEAFLRQEILRDASSISSQVSD
jgi:hypothetical protein